MINHTHILNQTLLKLKYSGLDLNDITPTNIKDIFPVLDDIPFFVWVTDRIEPIYLNTKGRAYYNFTMPQIEKEKTGIYALYLHSDTLHKFSMGGNVNNQDSNEATEVFFKVINGLQEVKWIRNISFMLSTNATTEHKYMLHISYDADEEYGKKMNFYNEDDFLDGKIPTLTEKEYDVLEQICKEFTSKEIATKLFMSKEAVNYHRKNLMMKLNAKSSIGVAMKAVQYSLV